jgi:YbgC/YbaW family acyl-CoA thioester hydrolase
MPRIKIELPDSFIYSTSMEVRITDLNYGAHVGNDKVLSFLHEARIRFLQSLNYSEFNLEGVGMIMADAALEFRSEMFYGDRLEISIQPAECSRVGFDLIYKIEKKEAGLMETVALAKTMMVCYDYKMKKVTRLPEAVKIKLFP